MEISPSTHELLRSEDGALIIQDNCILIRETKTDNMFLMPINKEILNSYGFYVWEEIEKGRIYNNTETLTETTETDETSNKWSHSDTLRLNALYKKYEKDFMSTTIKNLTVYKKISDELKAVNIIFSATQCKDKFKYIKMKYMKYKDSKKTSGAATRKFEFEEEMDAIFSKKPNEQPVAIASSLSPCQLSEEGGSSSSRSTILETEHETEVVPPVKKRKLSENVEAVERKHKEKLAMQEKAIKSFETTMGKLLDKL